MAYALTLLNMEHSANYTLTPYADYIVSKPLVWAHIIKPDDSIIKALVSPDEKRRLISEGKAMKI